MSPTIDPPAPRRPQPGPEVEEPTQAAELQVQSEKLGGGLHVLVPGKQAILLLLITLALGVTVGPIFILAAATSVSEATVLAVATMQVAALTALFLRATRK